MPVDGAGEYDAVPAVVADGLAVAEDLGRDGAGEHPTQAVVDVYTLLIHPLTLGSGTRLFEGPTPLTRFELTGATGGPS